MASRKRTYKTVQACVSPERHAELKAIADGEGIALSKLAGELINEALQARRESGTKTSDDAESDKIRKVLEIYKALQEQGW